jgi:hypothetical protein
MLSMPVPVFLSAGPKVGMTLSFAHHQPAYSSEAVLTRDAADRPRFCSLLTAGDHAMTLGWHPQLG